MTEIHSNAVGDGRRGLRLRGGGRGKVPVNLRVSSLEPASGSGVTIRP